MTLLNKVSCVIWGATYHNMHSIYVHVYSKPLHVHVHYAYVHTHVYAHVQHACMHMYVHTCTTAYGIDWDAPP